MMEMFVKWAGACVLGGWWFGGIRLVGRGKVSALSCLCQVGWGWC